MSIDTKPDSTIKLPDSPSASARSINPWLWAAIFWIGVIFFSSTSLASKWAETTFSFVSGEFLASLRHGSSYDLIHLLADKGFHVSLFCILAVLLWFAFRSVPRKAIVILLCGAVIGSLSEFLQSFFPDRDPALRDVLINTAGTALGILLCAAALSIAHRLSTR